MQNAENPPRQASGPQDTEGNDVQLMTVGIFGHAGLLADADRPEDWWEHAAGAAADELSESATMATLPTEKWENEAGELLWETAGRLAALIEFVDEHGSNAFDVASADTRADWREANLKLAEVQSALRQHLP